MKYTYLLNKMKTKTLRSTVIFWSLFIGTGALWGTTMMFIDPTGAMWGMSPLLEYMRVLPFPDIFFRNLIFSGIALLFANGITNIITFMLLKKKYRYASIAVIVCGVILMLWTGIQFIVFPLNFLSTLYFAFGVLQMLTGCFLWRKENRGTGHDVL